MSNVYAIRKELAQYIAAHPDEIAKDRLVFPGESDEEIAAKIYFRRELYNLERDYQQRRYDLNNLHSDVAAAIQLDRVKAEYDRKAKEG